MKITDVIGYYLSSPYDDGKVFGQPKGVKSIGIVEVHTDAGIVGIGETYAGVYVPELISPIADHMKHLLIGKDPLDIESICSVLNVPFIGMNGLYKSVASAINIALWDIKGKVLDTPIYKLFENYNIDIPEYASGGSVIYSPTEIEVDVENAMNQGFNAYKMRIGVQDWKTDLQRIKRAREILGDNDLMVDAIAGTLKHSPLIDNPVHTINVLCPYKLTWIEEPVHPEHIKMLEIIHAFSLIPIAMGEGFNGKLDFSVLLDKKCIDIIQPDVTHCGGITFAINILEAAKQENIGTAMHVWGSGISLIANQHVARAMNVDWLEVPMVSLAITDDLLDEDTIEKPGLGITITDEIKNKYKGVKGSGYAI